MKKILTVIIAAILFANCNFKRVEGSGVLATETRTISNAEKIKLMGSFDVELMPSAGTSLKIEGDDNLIKHITTENKDGFLEIKMENNINYSTKNKLVVYIATPHIETVSLVGSGNIITKGKFTGSNKLKVSLAGSGNANLQVNTPMVEASIAGSGNITLAGETQNVSVKIAGSGDFYGQDLKTENGEVRIAGSGNAKVFADVKLNIHIAGSGSVFYKGNAAVTQKIAGSGDVKKM